MKQKLCLLFSILSACCFSPEAHGAKPSLIHPLSEWTKESFEKAPYYSYLLEALVRETGGDITAFRTRFYPLVLGLSGAIGPEEDPRTLVQRGLACFTETFDFHKKSGRTLADHVLLEAILKKRAASPVMLTILFLSLIERHPLQKDGNGLPLEPVMVNGNLLLRYSFNHYIFNVSFVRRGEILTDRQTVEQLLSSKETATEWFRPLGKRELAGLLLNELALAYAHDENETDDEQQYFARALDFFPESSGILLNYTKELIKAGHLEKASEQVEKVVRNDPSCGEALFLKGILLWKKGGFQQARTLFLAAHHNNFTADGLLWLYLARLEYENLQGTSTAELKKHLLRFIEQTGRSDLESEIDTVVKQVGIRKAISTLKSKVPYQKKFNAADVIFRNPTNKGIETLIDALGDPNNRFRAYVWKLLCSIAEKELPLNSEKWLKWYMKRPREETTRLWENLNLSEGPLGE